MTIEPCCYDVETALGVPLSVTGVAHCKILRNPDLMMLATEQFLGKKKKEVKNTILQTLEGHLCAILGTMTVEEIYKDRERFAEQVYEVAKPDVGRMGIEILSFTIKDVFDNVEYLSSLGKSRTATVIKDADIGVANSNRDAGIKEAECLKAAMDAKFETDTKIEDDTRAYKLQVAEFEKEVNTAKAQAQLAYQLEAAKLNQKIKSEEIKIDVVVRKKEIEIEEQEILRKEKELRGTVKLPAEAEAESMRVKAKAYQQYGDAAVMALVVESLPKIAAEVAAPLARTEEIVMLGGSDKTTAEVTKLLGQLPASVKALTGVDLTG